MVTKPIPGVDCRHQPWVSAIQRSGGERDRFDGASAVGLAEDFECYLAAQIAAYLHVLELDGAYSFERGKARFHRAKALHPEELDALLTTVITRVTRTLVC